MKRLIPVGFLALVLLETGGADAQTIRAGGLTLDLTGRVQIQLNTTSVTSDDLGGGGDPPVAVFETRRLYFGTGFAYDDWLTGVVQADFGGATAALTDGYIDAALSAAFAVRMGQFKKPFGLFELTSNTKTLTVERSVRLRGVEDLVGVPGEAQYLLNEAAYLGRQIGVMAHGSVAGLGYAVGVFNGEGTNVRETYGSKAVAGRVTFAPVDGLVLGGAVSVQPTGEFDAGDSEVMATAFAVDAEWGAFRGDGLHVMAELLYGDDPLLLVPGSSRPPTMLGAQLVAAWFAPRDGRIEGWEPLLRVSWGDPDTEVRSDEGLLVTPGVNLYFTGRNRLMLNGEAYVPARADVGVEYGVVAQFQIYF